MDIHIIPRLIIAAFMLFTVSCSVSEIKETADTGTPASLKPGDCISCHDEKKVLPDDHVDTKGMKGSDCGSCHQPEGLSLWTKIPLSHIHQLAGISCNECHEDPASPEPADTAVCGKCHGDTQALIKAASELHINPHFSPHDGKTPACNKCHHVHKSSENQCAGCHGLEYKVP
ncbi:MAG: cytochrome c3 family protein [Deltaproteobacteria bacterium]|nr:cytochrome c3 family protein [Deltaproteobacteria bacterium]